MKKLITAALLSMAGLALTAHATITANPSDMLIGFQATSGTGAAQNLIVDIGPITNYINASASFNVAQLGADLTSIYGGFSSNTNLFWGVIGWDGGTNGTTLVGDKVSATATDVPGIANSTPNNVRTSSQLANSGSKIGAVIGGINGQTSNTVTPTGYNESASLGTSWTKNDGTPTGTADFASWTGSKLNDSTAISSGATFTAEDLYQYDAGTAGVFEGTFTLDSTGLLRFNVIPVSVPEPSTYAAILGVASLGIVAIRRRKQQILA